MDAHSPAHGCKTADLALHVLAHQVHQVGKLIDDHQNIGEFLPCQMTGLNLFVVPDDIPDTEALQELIAPIHLIETEIQGFERPLGFGDDRSKQVWNAIVNVQLNNLRID